MGKFRDELGSDPFLVLALLAALIALATTPLAFAVLGRLEWFKARRGRVMQRPEFSSIVGGMMLVMGIPAIFAALVIKSRSFDHNRYEFDPNRTWSVLDQGREYKTLKEADNAVRLEMERLALERKNLVNNVKKLDEAMLVLRSVAGTSPAVAQRFPSVLQSLAGVRKSVGVDGPQQLLDYTAPPVDLRALTANNPAAGAAPPTPSPASLRRLSRPQQPHRVTDSARSRSKASWLPCPNRSESSPVCFRFRVCRRNGRWVNRAIIIWKRFNADNLYEKIDGRAESFIQYGVKGMAYTFYHPTGDPSNELQLYVFEMADSLKALGKYGSEKPEEFQTVAVGDAGYTSAGSLLFYAGRYYTQIVSTKDDPKFAAFALDLAKRVANASKAGSWPGTARWRGDWSAPADDNGNCRPRPPAQTRARRPHRAEAGDQRDLAGDVFRSAAGPGTGRRPQVRRPGRFRL